LAQSHEQVSLSLQIADSKPRQRPGFFVRHGYGVEAITVMTRYVVWTGAVVAGTVLALIDWRWIKRPVFATLLVAGVVGGVIVTNVSPFTFAGGDHYMEGVIIAAGSALALVGYVLAVAGRFACRRIGGH
jgi:hypothetical protein